MLISYNFLLNLRPLSTNLLIHLQRTDLFNAHPKSLQFDRGTDEPKPEVATSRFRQALLTISGFYSKESQLLRGDLLCILLTPESVWLSQCLQPFSYGLQGAKIFIRQLRNMRQTNSYMKVTARDSNCSLYDVRLCACHVKTLGTPSQQLHFMLMCSFST